MKTSSTRSVYSKLAACIASASCAATSNLPASPPGVVAESITVTSKSFSSGGAIPVEHTCDGANTSPDLAWSSPPEGTRALVITVDDVEGSDETSTRWVIFDLKPEARAVHAGVDPVTLGSKLGRTDGKHSGYHGPCPARHQGHHYSFHVFALDRTLGLEDGAPRDAINAAMNGHLLGSGELVGTVVR